jgi:hypothetical protein
MQEKDINRNKNSFDNLIKEKFKDYCLTPDNDCWNEIERRLDAKTKKVILWPGISGVAVAVSILIWFIFPFNKKIIQNETTEQFSDYEERITKNVLEEKTVHPFLSSNSKSKQISQVSKTETSKAASSPELDVVEIQDVFPVEDMPVTGKPVRKKEKVEDLLAIWVDEPVSRVAPRKKTSIAFHLGSETVLAINAYPELQDYSYGLRSGIAMNAPAYLKENILKPEDFSHITHYAPISFGISVRKEFDYIFALESGLVYTFLASKFEHADPKRDAFLQLHYLGIPLNLQAKIYRNRSNTWNIYSSLGGMIEKGLLSHYSQNQYYDNSVIKTIVKEKIDGWQWSLNASLGFDYKLIENYSLYIEPKVSYYLRNNQPMSIRTRNPLIIGLNAGIRYSW